MDLNRVVEKFNDKFTDYERSAHLRIYKDGSGSIREDRTEGSVFSFGSIAALEKFLENPELIISPTEKISDKKQKEIVRTIVDYLENQIGCENKNKLESKIKRIVEEMRTENK